ncbi:hypothetical protein Asp14428_70950 [Actinoplanes sp. NBRC 14428]|nr:hypothetical protein Asp14428_70950 [Actinoplanes sp. NBRC 14428]
MGGVMSDLMIIGMVAGIVVFVVVVELAAAVLPVLIVVTLVPPEERHGLAECLAAADSSRRLRVWRALRAAVVNRRRERRQR